MTKSFSTLVLIAVLSCTFTVPASASLIGSTVTGSLTFVGDSSNYFDPGYGFVPVGYLNASGTAVTVAAKAVEFGFNDGASLITADLSANQITLSDAVEMSGPANSFQLTFTDPSFAGFLATALSGGGIPSDFSLTGTALTLDYPGADLTAGETLTTTLELAPVPEPSTLTLMLTSVTAMFAVLGHRRLRSSLLNRRQ